MSDSEQQVEQPVEEPVEEPKITTKEEKKEKDPKRVAQGKRLAQISKAAKEKKMRDKIESESHLDLSLDYKLLWYFGVPSIVFAGFYFYFRNQTQPASAVNTSEEPAKQPARKVVSLFD